MNRNAVVANFATTASDGKTYQVAVLFEYDKTVCNVPVTDAVTIGLDYKSDGLYVDSNGKTADMPHYYRKSDEKLAKS